MKQFFLVMGVTGLTLCATAQQGNDAPKAAVDTPTAEGLLKTPLDTFSYALGMNIGHTLKQQDIKNINVEAMQKAMEDIFQGRQTVINDQQASISIQTTIQANNSKKLNAEKAKCADFLANNKNKAGVIALPNGLQYEVIKSGDQNSPMPQLEDTVVAHYAGTLIDGTEFDNSYKRGQPLTIPVAGVIRGWTEILQKMHVGDKWKVYIPSDLGYGDNGTPDGSIPGGSALIFDMELVAVKKAGAKQKEPVIDMSPSKPGTKPAKKPATGKAPAKKKA